MHKHASARADPSWVKVGCRSLGNADGPLLLSHLRECNDVSNGRRIGEQHDQPVDPKAHASSGRHSLFESQQEVLVDIVSLLVTGRLLGCLQLKPLTLWVACVCVCLYVSACEGVCVRAITITCECVRVSLCACVCGKSRCMCTQAHVWMHACVYMYMYVRMYLRE